MNFRPSYYMKGIGILVLFLIIQVFLTGYKVIGFLDSKLMTTMILSITLLTWASKPKPNVDMKKIWLSKPSLYHYSPRP